MMSSPTTALPSDNLVFGSDHDAAECAVVELRQYTLHPGKRDVLIELFDRQFVESQETLGMHLLGQFRDQGDADRFVWMRGFRDMASRLQGLTDFYTGPVWMAHRSVANDTMVDSDNVLLLKPAWPGSGLKHRPQARAAIGAPIDPPGVVDITVFSLRHAADESLLAFCREAMTGVLQEAGARDVAWYVTEEAPNNFPRLPVRTGEHVLMGVAVFRDAAHYDAFIGSGAWDQRVAPMLDAWSAGKSQSMRLTPTSRSALHA